MLTCQSVVELVTEYLENALSASDRMSFEVHLAMCNECTLYVDQIRGTVHALRTVGPDLPIPPCDDLVEAFREYRNS